ncbi:DUF6350 family protein [Agromyces sp. MMS24-JH15]|uniref:cell division protein PerM n=1 Tax=Agromyces sp. MMS24-JH15 TaxID=3243765 RepID=UPI00374916A3
MNRLTVVLLAALEAAVSAFVGFGIVLVPLMLLWAIHFGLELDAEVFLRAAGDIWLLGHGVDLTVTLDAVSAELVGVPGAEAPFTLSIALLGFAFATVLFGRRIGRRSAAAGHAIVGGVTAVGVYAAFGAVVGLLVDHPAASSRWWEAILLPAAVMALGVVIGSTVEALRLADLAGEARGDGPREHPLAAMLLRLPPAVLATGRAMLRVGVGAAFAVVGVAAVVVAVLIGADYATVVGLAGSLDAGVDGGIALVVGELAVLPNLVVWAAAWLLGPGFAFGAGTSLSPTATVVGPLPGVPILGIVPSDGVPLGLLWLLVPLSAGFAGATFVWPWLVGALAPASRPAFAGLPASLRPAARRDLGAAWWLPAVLAAGAGVAAGVVMGALAWWSSGAVGPGRLVQVGPDPIPVASMAALTVFVGALAGASTARALGIDPGHVRDHERDDRLHDPRDSRRDDPRDHRPDDEARLSDGASARDANATEPLDPGLLRGVPADRDDPGA